MKTARTPRGSSSVAPWLVALILAAALGPVRSQTSRTPKCIACDLAPRNVQYWRHPLGLVCNNCKELDRNCSVCGLPAYKDYKQTKDGRVICRREAPYTAIENADVEKTFKTTRESVTRMTRGFMKLKNTHVAVQVFDFDYWNSDTARGKIKSSAGALHRMGMAMSRPTGSGMSHNVLLVSGQPYTNLTAVCAHEFTHLWINENRPLTHNIEPQTVEAICELVAYEHAKSRKHLDHMKRIEENSYTEGRVNKLIPLLDRYGLKTLLRWVAEGSAPTVTTKELAHIHGAPVAGGGSGLRSPAYRGPRAAPSRPKGSPLYSTVPRTPKKTPTTLKLKGIIGNMALINDVAFQVGEEKILRIGDKSVRVKCEEIQAAHVKVRLDGAETLTQLNPQ